MFGASDALGATLVTQNRPHPEFVTGVRATAVLNRPDRVS
jgi:hypothetical protein